MTCPQMRSNGLRSSPTSSVLPVGSLPLEDGVCGWLRETFQQLESPQQYALCWVVVSAGFKKLCFLWSSVQPYLNTVAFSQLAWRLGGRNERRTVWTAALRTRAVHKDGGPWESPVSISSSSWFLLSFSCCQPSHQVPNHFLFWVLTPHSQP